MLCCWAAACCFIHLRIKLVVVPFDALKLPWHEHPMQRLDPVSAGSCAAAAAAAAAR